MSYNSQDVLGSLCSIFQDLLGSLSQVSRLVFSALRGLLYSSVLTALGIISTQFSISSLSITQQFTWRSNKFITSSEVYILSSSSSFHLHHVVSRCFDIVFTNTGMFFCTHRRLSSFFNNREQFSIIGQQFSQHRSNFINKEVVSSHFLQQVTVFTPYFSNFNQHRSIFINKGQFYVRFRGPFGAIRATPCLCTHLRWTIHLSL